LHATRPLLREYRVGTRIGLLLSNRATPISVPLGKGRLSEASIRLKAKLCVGEDDAAGPLFCQGWVVGETRDYGDPLVIFILKSRRREINVKGDW
jgi:hypothetical protein